MAVRTLDPDVDADPGGAVLAVALAGAEGLQQILQDIRRRGKLLSDLGSCMSWRSQLS